MDTLISDEDKEAASESLEVIEAEVISRKAKEIYDKDGNGFVTSYKRNCRIWIGSCGFDSICWINVIVTSVKIV